MKSKGDNIWERYSTSQVSDSRYDSHAMWDSFRTHIGFNIHLYYSLIKPILTYITDFGVVYPPTPGENTT